ncbi:MAG: hypothetical protein ACK58L_06810 [Planctomycetota bacterium]
MSVVRFLHIDSLRLGSAVGGLSDCPDWLRKVAGSAVRTSVTNAIEVAIAGRCQFVLIAGRVTEQELDLDLALSWMTTAVQRLKEHGIRLVLTSNSEAESAAFRRLDAIVLSPGQRLDVSVAGSDRAELMLGSRTIAARRDTLGIEVGSETSARPLADFAYVAVPAVRASEESLASDGVSAAHDRLLRLSAGATQALGPSERGVSGAQLVEANFVRQSLTARFCPTDVIRFAQELVSTPFGITPVQLCELLRERSRAIAIGGRCTTVVEWIIDGHLLFTLSGQDSLCEMELLRDLRNGLHGGHAGAWPCRIRFSDSSTVDAGIRMSPVTAEFSSVVCDRFQRTERSRRKVTASLTCIPLGAGCETAIGLDVLRRVA